MAQSPLNLEVRKRLGAIKLKQMTNEENSANNINDSVLEAACSDAMAAFLRLTGYVYDNSNPIHIQICFQGVLSFLETYKSRDSSIVSLNQNNFFRACADFRNKAVLSASASITYNQFPQPNPEQMRDSDIRQPIYSDVYKSNKAGMINE